MHHFGGFRLSSGGFSAVFRPKIRVTAMAL
jgi:hypothetical protein